MRVISGSARGTVLHSIEDISTRPTLDRVKESLFNIIQNDIEDTTVLDLFAGSGAIGIEFLSRRAKQVYFCDKSSKAVAMIEKNLEKTKLKERNGSKKEEKRNPAEPMLNFRRISMRSRTQRQDLSQNLGQ